MLQSGVRGRPDVDAIAARHDREITVLVWNYQDDDVAAPASPIDLAITGIPDAAKTVLLEDFRVDASHSNSFAEWQNMNSPAHPSVEQQKRLEDAGQLQEMASPRWVAVKEGHVNLNFALPRQGLSLIRIIW
jgi:xylan 1,4-beta-xylosidase